MTPHDAPICPVCARREHVRRLPAVFEANRQVHIETCWTTDGHGDWTPIEDNVERFTALGRAIAPPAKPWLPVRPGFEHVMRMFAIVLGGGAITVAVTVVSTFVAMVLVATQRPPVPESDAEWGLVALWFSTVVPLSLGPFVWLGRREMADYRRAVEAHEVARSRREDTLAEWRRAWAWWDGLWICAADGSVISADGREAFPSSELRGRLDRWG